VLLELSVPLADGETVVATLRDRGIAPPILLGSAAPELPQVSARLGLSHLSKPYAAEALLAKLRELALLYSRLLEQPQTIQHFALELSAGILLLISEQELLCSCAIAGVRLHARGGEQRRFGRPHP